jgi:CRP-like cAMP-binding protein
MGDDELDCTRCPVGASYRSQGLACPLLPREVEADGVLYREGDPTDYAWLIKRGQVVLSRRDRGAAVRATRRAGSFVGLETLVRDRYYDTALAVGEVKVCAAPREAMARWLGTEATPARVVLDLLLEADET